MMITLYCIKPQNQIGCDNLTSSTDEPENISKYDRKVDL